MYGRMNMYGELNEEDTKKERPGRNQGLRGRDTPLAQSDPVQVQSVQQQPASLQPASQALTQSLSTPLQNGTLQPGVPPSTPSQNGTIQPGVPPSTPLQNRTMQPGVPQPTPSQNGTMQPGVPQPTPSQNGTMQPGMPQPTPSQNGTMQPDVPPSAPSQSGTMQPDVSQPTPLQDQPIPPQPGPAYQGQYSGYAGNPPGIPVQVRALQPVGFGEKLEQILNRFGLFGVGSLLYGILFAFCIYPGFQGISIPVISAVTMAGLMKICRILGVPLKKSAWFYFISWGLLSVSSVLTGSVPVIVFNTCGMYLLFLSFLFTHFCNTEKWGFAKYLGQICIAPFLAMAYLYCPFQSCRRYIKQKEKEKSTTVHYIWMGIGISLPVLFVLILLLTSADAVFRNLFTQLLRNIRFPEHPFWMILLLFVGVWGSYALLACFADGKIPDKVGEKKRWEPVIGISFLSVITVLYLFFSVIQISYLFLGGFRLPEGYSYSSYAREGFFQLLIVCLINLCIILLCISWFREHRVLKWVLTVFSCCTYIMIASSAMRMLLYVGMHHLTFLRVLVLWALTLLTVLLTGCIVTIYKPRFPLFQFTMVTVTVFYIAFSLARPDNLIIRYNLAHDRQALSSDDWYWFRLSSDAIPVLEKEGVLAEIGWDPDMPRADMDYSQKQLKGKLDDYRAMGIRDFNLSCYVAGKILESY